MSSSPTGEAADVEAASPSSYDGLLALLQRQAARYRLLEHEAEGRTDLVSAMRGHPVTQAAKCVVVMVKLGKKTTHYVLAVVPGDARVNFTALKQLLGGTYAAFASSATAEDLAGSVSGTILPFSFHDRLELIVDPGLLSGDEMFFNAARLDRSLALDSRDYRAIAQPRVEVIATRTESV